MLKIPNILNWNLFKPVQVVSVLADCPDEESETLIAGYVNSDKINFVEGGIYIFNNVGSEQQYFAFKIEKIINTSVANVQYEIIKDFHLFTKGTQSTKISISELNEQVLSGPHSAEDVSNEKRIWLKDNISTFKEEFNTRRFFENNRVLRNNGFINFSENVTEYNVLNNANIWLRYDYQLCAWIVKETICRLSSNNLYYEYFNKGYVISYVWNGIIGEVQPVKQYQWAGLTPQEAIREYIKCAHADISRWRE